MKTKDVIRSMVVALAALLASNAQAFDYHGYFRDSVAFNSEGGNQVCFALPDSNFKSRLANECGRYLEIAFGENGKFQSIDWRLEFMPASAVGSNGVKADNFIMQQMWLGMRFNDWDGAQVWAGRRYWRRQAVNAIDWFYWNPAQGNAAAGVEDVKLGFGKLAVTLIGMEANSGNLALGTYMVPDIRLYDVAVNPGGSLEVGVDLAIAHDQNKALGANRAGTSPLFSIQHRQANVFGGSNLVVFQYGQGAFAKESGDGPGQLLAGGSTDDKQWRVIENLIFNPTSDVSGELVLVYQDIKAPAATTGPRIGNTGRSIFSAEVRPSYHLTDWFKLTADVFYQTISYKDAPAGSGTPNLVKATLAPTFVLGRKYDSRPELRFYVTYGSWNDAAGPTTGGGAFGTATNGTVFGAQLESWF